MMFISSTITILGVAANKDFHKERTVNDEKNFMCLNLFIVQNMTNIKRLVFGIEIQYIN